MNNLLFIPVDKPKQEKKKTIVYLDIRINNKHNIKVDIDKLGD